MQRRQLVTAAAALPFAATGSDCSDIPGLPFTRPSWERARAIAAELSARGVLTKLRDSAGQDVEGGCGQLRAREAVGRPGRVVRIHA